MWQKRNCVLFALNSKGMQEGQCLWASPMKDPAQSALNAKNERLPCIGMSDRSFVHRRIERTSL